MCHTESTVLHIYHVTTEKEGNDMHSTLEGGKWKKRNSKSNVISPATAVPGIWKSNRHACLNRVTFFYLKASMNPDTTATNVVLETVDDEPQSIEAEPLTTDSRR